ncbi:quinone oxidoreductase family protein [Pseudalkalibacillus caeni]|uniref:Quinone oxidoreductase n=1 Tax=Exobacillus caeni TaxID=2574798 RepID=A0A5R9F7I7_9BACL|nr:quinone oxidoreductase [Pseudalkalibacillus caeni]TLS38296.1 quinone oxidoreductase [Pseudalkalibacillus caeni]
MKAIQFEEYGGPEVLKAIDTEKPEPAGRQVLIEVKAVGVNYADTARREGQYVVPTPLPFIPGAEIAGIVKEIGPGVKSVKECDRVVTLISSNGYAEYALADERTLVPLPEEVDFTYGAAILLQGLTAYHVLKTSGQLQEGETVLIHAGAGGVGSIAIQLAKIFGAGKVIATASSEEKRQFAKDLGADVVIDYTKEGWEKELDKATDGKGVDVALEMVGGEVFSKTLAAMAPFGRVVVYGKAGNEQPNLNPVMLMGKNHTVTGFFLPQIMRKPDLYSRSLGELLKFIQEGRVKLTIGGTYPLEEAAKVHELLQSRATKGKLVLEP